MDKSPRDKWKECLGIIRNNLDERQFNTWFEPTKFKSYDQEKKELTIYIPSNFFYEYLEGHFLSLYTSDAADDLLCVDLGGRRIIKKKK